MGKKNQIKVKFAISVKCLYNLSAENVGNIVFMTWKRGSKAQNKGESKKATVDKDKQAVLNEEIHLISTLTQDIKTKKMDPKKIEFTIKEEVKKKTKPLGKLVVDLAEYSSIGDHDSISLPIVPKTKPKSGEKDPSLKLSIKSVWTHFNKRPMTEKRVGAQSAGAGNTIEIDGKEFDLHTAEEDLSEATTDIAGESDDDDDDDPFKDDDAELKEMGGSGRKDPRASGEVATSRGSMRGGTPASPAAPGGAAGGGGSEREKELEKEVKKLEAKVAALKEDVKREKEKARQKHMEATSEKQEVKKLRKELADVKKSKSKSPLESELDVLKEQLENANKQKRELEEKLKTQTVGPKEVLQRDLAIQKEMVVEKYMEVDSLAEKLKAREAEVASLNKQLKALQDRSGDHKAILDDKEKQNKLKLDKSEERVRQLEAEVAGLKRIKEQKDELQKQYDDYKRVKDGEVLEMQKKFNQTDLELQKVKAMVDSKIGELAALRKSQTGAGDEQLKSTLSKLESAQGELAELRKTVEMKNSEISDLKGRLTRETEALKREKEALKKERDTLEQQNNNLKKDLAAATEKANKQPVGKPGEREKIRKLKKIKRDLRAEVDSHEQQIKKMKEDFDKEKAKLKASGGTSVPAPAFNAAAAVEKEKKKNRKIDKLKKIKDDLKAEVEILKKNSAANGKAKGNDDDEDGDAQSELDIRRVIEQAVYCADMTYEYDADSGGEQEEDDDVSTPVSSEKLFSFLLDKDVFDEDADNTQLFKYLSRALKGAIRGCCGDMVMQCSWLSYTTSLLHTIIKEDEDFFKRDDSNHIKDPKKNGVQVVNPKKKIKHEFALFLDELQGIIFRIYDTMVKLLFDRIEPLIGPAILYQPATIIMGEGAVHVPRECMKKPEDIVFLLDDTLSLMRERRIYPIIIKQYFVQVFYLLDAAIFNNLMEERSSLCSAEHAFQIKFAVARLSSWVSSKHKELNTARTKAQLNPVLEAVSVLVVDKSIFGYEENLKEFPSLNPAQILHLLENFQPDSYSPEAVPASSKDLLSKLAARGKGDSLMIDISAASIM